MAVALRAAANANTGAGGTSMTITKPTGVVDGDVLILGSTARGNFQTLIQPTCTAQRDTIAAGAYQGCAYGNGLFVAVGSDGSGNGRIATSPDGITWTQRTSNYTGTLRAVAYGGGKYVAAGSGGNAVKSTNGTTWSGITGTLTGVVAMAYGAGVFVAVGNTGALWSSSDGETWTSRTSGSSANINCVTYGNSKFMWGDANGQVNSSTDGITWGTPVTVNGSESISGLAFGDSRWIAQTGTRGWYSDNNGAGWSSTAEDNVGVYGGNCAGFGPDGFVMGGSPIRTSIEGTKYRLIGGSMPVILALATDGARNWIFVSASAIHSNDGGLWMGVNTNMGGSSGDSRQNTYWKVAKSEPASYPIAITPSAKASAVAVAWSGVDPTARPLNWAEGANASDTTIEAPALAAQSATNGVDVGVFSANTGTTITPPTNYTEPTNGEAASTGNAAGTRTTTEISYRILTGSTGEGQIVATSGSAATSLGMHLFLKEYAAPTVTGDAALTNSSTLTAAGNVTKHAAAALSNNNVMVAESAITGEGALTNSSILTAAGTAERVATVALSQTNLLRAGTTIEALAALTQSQTLTVDATVTSALLYYTLPATICIRAEADIGASMDQSGDAYGFSLTVTDLVPNGQVYLSVTAQSEDGVQNVPYIVWCDDLYPYQSHVGYTDPTSSTTTFLLDAQNSDVVSGFIQAHTYAWNVEGHTGDCLTITAVTLVYTPAPDLPVLASTTGVGDARFASYPLHMSAD